MTTTPNQSSTPASIGTAQLKELLDSAPEKNSIASGPFDGLTEEEVKALAKRTLDAFDERCNHPVAQKLLAMIIISNGIGWHTRSGVASGEEGNVEEAISWLRDGGKLQAAAQALASVSYGPDDFTYS